MVTNPALLPTAPDTAASTARDTAGVDGTRPPRLPFTVVGIGVSAGGLEAMAAFLDAMPADGGLAFVLVRHASSECERMAVDVLQKHTAMPVLQADDGVTLEPNHVYVIRPGHTMTLRDGRLRSHDSRPEPGHARPVDDFFRSLATEQRERSVCVVLNGTGSDGTAGAQAVKVVGGMSIAQEPDSAELPFMPRGLIDANLADFILRPAEMPELLLRYAGHPYASGPRTPEVTARNERHQIDDIVAILRARTRHDFSGYKKPTLVRRIQRRMSLTQATGMADYARVLRQTSAEVIHLADDLMIHVTGFFRDPEVWESLRENVITPLVAEKPDRSTIRAWVTACASGEEAYTVAMLLHEAAEAADKTFDIKVFATDMAERTLTHARAGLFAAGIERELSPTRLGRYFDKDDGLYRVRKELRELVVFAPQNVLQDPPFSRLDLVTCRNLLIYLEPEIQQKVLGLLHFGLRDGAALVLGNSETIGETDGLFEPIDTRLRIFRRVGPTRHGMVDFPMPRAIARQTADASDVLEARVLSRASLTQIANKSLLDDHTPAAVVVDRYGRIVFFHGGTEQFLDQPRGEPTRDILRLARDFIRGSVRAALHRSIDAGDPTVAEDAVMDGEDGPRRVDVRCTPLDRRGIPGYFLITFTAYPVAAVSLLPNSASIAGSDLAGELQTVQDELQSTIEELQTSNEELKTSNEEVTSINEELQSANEELETSREELQSLNEELTTVNARLHAKIDELERASSDLTSLLSSTEIAVIFLDIDLRIRRFTPAVGKLMDLIPSDTGRPLADMAWKFADPKLLADAGEVLQSLVPIEKLIPGDGDRWYTRRILPYCTNDRRIDGVVVTFADVTERKLAGTFFVHHLEPRA